MLLIYLFACRGEEPTSVPETVDQAPLRRMTERQFNNSIRDIFPDTELPYLLLPHTGLEGFYDNDISTVNPNNSTISAFQDIAMQLSISLYEEEIFFLRVKIPIARLKSYYLSLLSFGDVP